MSYPSFTKIIIDYFMPKDQSISRRNKMFWHTARDDTMFTSMRCISRHEDTQVYGTILPKELTNQAMLESNAYKTYYDIASGEKTPKPKYVQKKADPDTSPKQKPVQATKGTRLKSKAKVTKPNKKKQPAKKPKAKRLAVLSEGDSEDEDNENDSDDLSDESDDDNDGNNGNDGDDDDANDDDKQKGDDTNDDDEETDNDRTESDRIKIPILDQSTTEYYKEEEEEKIDDEEMMYDDEDDEVIKELYEDVNVNLGNEDTEMTNADQGASEQQNTGDPTQSSSVSSNFTNKLLDLDNLSPTDNEIASLMDTTAQHATIIPEITLSFTTTIPSPPSFFNPLSQQATPTPTPTASNTTTSLPALPDFASVFKFNERVTNLEKDLLEIKKVD
ncbi:hypothetical protein Tco_1571028 [Tanacetum coccineum]